MSKPDYITENTDGTVTVKLTDGRTISLREPTVGDELAAKGDDAAREIALLGNLAALSPDEMRAMTSRNYRRLQAGLMVFRD